MKAFRFPLQRVLDVKMLLEEQQQQALAAARAEKEATAARLEAARTSRAAAVKEDGAHAHVHPWLRDMAWRRRERLLGRVRQLGAELDEARRREEAERDLLVQRHKERRVLERLAEKQRMQHALEQARREQSILDEAAANRRRRPWVGGSGE